MPGSLHVFSVPQREKPGDKIKSFRCCAYDSLFSVRLSTRSYSFLNRCVHAFCVLTCKSREMTYSFHCCTKALTWPILAFLCALNSFLAYASPNVLISWISQVREYVSVRIYCSEAEVCAKHTKFTGRAKTNVERQIQACPVKSLFSLQFRAHGPRTCWIEPNFMVMCVNGCPKQAQGVCICGYCMASNAHLAIKDIPAKIRSFREHTNCIYLG